MLHSRSVNALILSQLFVAARAFIHLQPQGSNNLASTRRAAIEELVRPATFLDEEEDDGLNVLFLDEKDEEEQEDQKPEGEGRKRWEALNPKTKKRLIEEGQAKAIANKKKREPAQDAKRRMMMHFKEMQRKKKMASRVQRPLGFDERAPLTAFVPGMEVSGVVISMTNYGAYVDVGTECDGLLHISQITRKFFVEHPRQVLSPGDEVTVTVRKASPELKKLQLTMLGLEKEDESDAEQRIPLSDIEGDDELWGELKRVTDYGAYVEVGAEVDGFLHFMDHPSWSDGMHPSDFMENGQRVRVWVSDVDQSQRRIKLTANRPTHLPGPRIVF